MSYGVCSICGRGPTIANDSSGLCQACKLSTGLSAQEGREVVVSRWRQLTGIEPGMERSEALLKFIEFRNNPTCKRCGGKKFMKFCSANLICKQDEMEEVNDDGDESVGIQETQAYFAG